MDRWDVLALLGIVLLGVGLWLLAPWLGFAVAGACLLALGVIGSVFTEKAAAMKQLVDAQKGG
ncbi:hypothetical protein [Streptomyces phaeochromogenes]